MAKKTTGDYFISFDARDIGQLKFETADEVIDWLDSELTYWNWATKPMAIDIAVFNHQRREIFLGYLSNATNELRRLIQKPGDDNAKTSAARNIEEYLKIGLASKSARAKFINSLREGPHGDVVAQSALATYLGEPFNPDESRQPYQFRYPCRQGRMAIVLFDAGLNPQSMVHASESLSEIGAENSRVLGQLVANHRTEIAALQGIIDSAKNDHELFVENVKHRFDEALTDFSSNQDAIVKKCDDAHAKYTSVMELQGPVNYWTDKHKGHKNAAWWWGAGLLAYTLFGITILAITLSMAFNYAKQSTGTSYSHTDFLISAAVALIVTVLFWIARFISRLYLSERHMGIDAKLRAVMAKTYLALASNQQVSDQDRALVLAPLFRAGTDGIIQEETGLDSAVAMLARALERPAR